MFKIGDSVLYEGIDYRILWIYSNGYCELVESSLSSAYKSILVQIDELHKAEDPVGLK
jgi:hypothetical protein